MPYILFVIIRTLFSEPISYMSKRLIWLKSEKCKQFHRNNSACIMTTFLSITALHLLNNPLTGGWRMDIWDIVCHLRFIRGGRTLDLAAIPSCHLWCHFSGLFPINSGYNLKEDVLAASLSSSLPLIDGPELGAVALGSKFDRNVSAIKSFPTLFFFWFV